MASVVLPGGRDDDSAVTVRGDLPSRVLPPGVGAALPQLFIETALPLALVDAEGHLLAVNSGFCALVGRSANALATANMSELLHPDERIAHTAAWHALLGGITHADRVAVRLMRPDGSAIAVVCYRTVVAHDGGRQGAMALVACHDETAATHSAGHRDVSGVLATQLAAAHDKFDMGELVARTVADVAGDAAWVWGVDDDLSLPLLGSWHREDIRRSALTPLLQPRIPAPLGLLANAVARGEAIRADGDMVRRDSVLGERLLPYVDTYGVAELLLVALRAGDRLVGVLGLLRDGGASAYDDDTTEQVMAIAGTAALGLGNVVAADKARRDERFARSVLDAMPVMAAVLDKDGQIVDVNAAWLRAMDDFGGPLHTGIGENYLHLWDTAAATGVIGAADVAGGVRDVLHGVREEFEGDCTYPRLNARGDLTDLWFHVHAVQLTVGQPEGQPMVVVDHQDITDRKRLEVRLSFEATHDPLTRLPNRTLLIDRIEQALVRDRRAGLRTAVLFCDLDYFKQINDQFGHDGGDAVLRAAARQFARTVRASDTVARIGGDEFVVLIESVSDLDEALLVADKLVLSLREPRAVADGTEPPLPGVSVGVAVSDDTSTAESLLRDADAAMYTAKQSGRSRVESAGS